MFLSIKFSSYKEYFERSKYFKLLIKSSELDNGYLEYYIPNEDLDSKEIGSGFVVTIRDTQYLIGKEIIFWKNGATDVSFEEFFELLPEEIRSEFLFSLDVFRYA